MKQNKFRFFSIVLLGLMLGTVISCQEQYTEEDALNAQQEIALTIYVVDGSSADFKPIANAKVSLIQGEATAEVTTTESGVANFPKIKVGGYAYKITADNFATISGTNSANPSNFRQGQVTQQVNMYATSGENTATIRGTATMEKDVTNANPEVAANIKIFVDVFLNSGTQTFSATTDANGIYEVKVPTNGPTTSTSVQVRFPDFEADQVVAINRYADETTDFYSEPQNLPRKETIKTVFSVSTNGQLNRLYVGGGSFNVRSIYAVAEAPPAGGTRAIIDQVFTNNKGEVTGLSFWTGGNYTGDADGKVNVTVTSLDGGQGGSFTISLTGAVTTTSASTGYFNNTLLIAKGSGYPVSLGSNYTLNKIAARTPTGRTSFTISPSTVNIANIDYGTGIARPKQLN